MCVCKSFSARWKWGPVPIAGLYNEKKEDRQTSGWAMGCIYSTMLKFCSSVCCPKFIFHVIIECRDLCWGICFLGVRLCFHSISGNCYFSDQGRMCKRMFGRNKQTGRKLIIHEGYSVFWGCCSVCWSSEGFRQFKWYLYCRDIATGLRCLSMGARE